MNRARLSEMQMEKENQRQDRCRPERVYSQESPDYQVKGLTVRSARRGYSYSAEAGEAEFVR